MLDEINKLCKEKVTVYGYANLKNIAPNHDSDSLISTYPYAVSIGISIPDKVIDTVDVMEVEKKYLKTYTDTNKKLDETGLEIEKILRKHDYNAKAVRASEIISREKLIGTVSHKLIANLAGLGWIGKSCLLINPYYGPRIRWVSVLTDAPLPYAKKRLPIKCGNCRLCSVNCPAGAIKNVKFNENSPREDRYDAYACNKHFKELEKQNRPRLCGICIKVCPWGLINKKSRKKYLI